MKQIYSWNVNGIRAAERKGFVEWMQNTGADIICVQETKAQPEQLSAALSEPRGYHAYWSSARKKGYSGVALYSKEKPRSVAQFGVERFDNEGRVLIAEYEHFVLLNAYFPNSQAAAARLDYKLDFNNEILNWAQARVGENTDIVICGDYNVAHKAIDLANPASNEKNPGYLPEERAWMDSFTQAGFVDSFRMFSSEAEQYTWWSMRTRARETNTGWRIDYHCVNEGFKEKVASAQIHADILGSDHCPVSIELAL